MAQKIPIPANSFNSKGPCYDYQLYFKKRPPDSATNFYLQPDPKCK